jgi:hypothetical protein
MVMRPEASFPLARALRSRRGAPIGEVFAFLGLYVRGKLAYARTFAPDRSFVITANDGLYPLDRHVTVASLRAFAGVDIRHDDDRFAVPLARDAELLSNELPGAEVVLLGSIASKKYVELLGEVFRDRLLFPSEFVGRGDMSRGGLLLRAARAGEELDYQRVLGATRRGKRPPKLVPVRGILIEASQGGGVSSSPPRSRFSKDASG